MKNLLIIKALREFRESLASYFFLVLILAMGFAALFAIDSFMNTRINLFDRIYSENKFMDLDTELLYNKYLSANEIDTILNQLPSNDNIKSYEKRLEYNVVITKQNNSEDTDIIKGLMLGYDINQNRKVGDIEVNKPLFYESDYKELGENEIYLEKNFADYYKIKRDDELAITYQGKSFTLKIADLVNVADYVIVSDGKDITVSEATLGVMIAPIKLANKIFTTQADTTSEELYNDIVISLKDSTKLDLFENDIKNALLENGIQAEFINKDENFAHKTIRDDNVNDKQMFKMFPVMFFFTASLGLFVVMKRTIDTKKTEIGLYKALGVKSSVIYRFYIITAIILSFFSIIFGIIISYGMMEMMMKIIEIAYDFPIRERYMSYESIITGSIITVIVTLISVIIPVRSAVRMPTIDALQKREGIDKADASGLTKIVSKLDFLPPSIRISLKYIFRNPIRNLTTSMSIIISVALFLGMYLTVYSFSGMIDSAKKFDNWDYMIQLAGFQENLNLEGIDKSQVYVQPALNLPVILKQTGRADEEIISYGINFSEIKTIFDVELENNDEIGKGIILSRDTADKFGVKIGDEVTINVPVINETGGINYEDKNVIVSNIHDFIMKKVSFIDVTTLQELTSFKDQYNFVYVKKLENINDTKLKNDILQVPGVSSVMTSEQRKEQYDSAFATFNMTLILILFLSSLMALSIIYNMYTLNVTNRIRDYSTMRTLGTSMTRISKLLAVESVILIFIGFTLGIGASILFALSMLGQIAQTMGDFVVKLSFEPMGLLWSFLMILGVVVFVYILVIRRIARLDLASMLKYRAN